MSLEPPPLDEWPDVATRKVLELAGSLFPTALKPTVPDPVRVPIALLARCVTTTESCLHLSELGRRSDLMATVRSLFEHVVMFMWLFGDADAVGDRLLCWERWCDQEAVRMDDETVRLGGEALMDVATRAAIAEAASKPITPARLPNLADRAIQADRDWADRLGFDRAHRDWASLRRAYTVIYRAGSSMAHPSLAGISITTTKSTAGVSIDLEPPGKAHEALMPVPLLLVTALAGSAHLLGNPGMRNVNAFLDWMTSTAPKPASAARRDSP